MRGLRAVTLDSAALTLEPQTAAHALQMYPVLCDPAIYRHENEPPRSIEWLLRRFIALEARGSADRSEQWLNWVVRDDASGALTGYVQATVGADGTAAVAYEFASAWWGRGIAFASVGAMLDELATRYGVHQAFAVLKAANRRSRRLLSRLCFEAADAVPAVVSDIERDEICLTRRLLSRAA